MQLNLERVSWESPSEMVTLSKDLKEIRSQPCGCLRESFSGRGNSQCECPESMPAGLEGGQEASGEH